MSLLAIAIQQQNWELAALCLLYSLAQALSQLPPDAVEGVLDALEVKPGGRKKA